MGTVMYENCPDEPHYDGAAEVPHCSVIRCAPLDFSNVFSIFKTRNRVKKGKENKSGVLLPLSLLCLYRN